MPFRELLHCTLLRIEATSRYRVCIVLLSSPLLQCTLPSQHLPYRVLYVQVVKALVELSSVDVAAVNLMGRTPLHLAALSLRPEVCNVLIDAMEASTGERPVGVNAPVDLLGLTPAAIAGKGAPLLARPRRHLSRY